MRVLVVTSLFPTPEHPERGRFVADQVESLGRIEGVEVAVFQFEPGGASFVSAARELRRKHGRDRFDVVHAHHGLGGWTARALGGGAPLVVTFHGTDLEHKVVGRASRALARLATLPATVSTNLARRRLPGAGHTQRVAVLPVGIDLDRFRPIERAEARAALGLDPDGRYLLFPSDPARPEKRHDRAAAVARETGAELLAYGQVDPERVPLYINAVSAVLVTSEREGFGLAALEALACDVPVLATDVGIAPLALDGIDGTLCARFDTAVWSATAGEHLEQGDSRVSGRARASLFGRDRMAARVFQAYVDLIE
ncbi:MAG TPA: glycosyltransferase [Thermoleophilaceae bacterium]|nr:glycosyltransferase [Thermoleophilaceae bacterium]